MEKLKQYESFFGYSFHGSEVPDGEYSVVIVGAEKGKSKNDDPQLRLRLSVDEGDYRGAQFLKRYTINSEASVSYFYRDVVLCGLQIHSLVSAFENHDLFVGLRLIVEKVTRGDWYSIYFRELLEGKRYDTGHGGGNSDVV